MCMSVITDERACVCIRVCVRVLLFATYLAPKRLFCQQNEDVFPTCSRFG